MHRNEATERVLQAALHVLSAERGPEENPNKSAEREYSDEQLGLAALDLVRAITAGKPHDRPIGWPENLRLVES